MNKVPPVILRWGNTLLVSIVGGLILACCFIKWPETEFTTFRWQWDADKKTPSIYVNIPANSLKNILYNKDKKFLYHQRFLETRKII